MQDDRINLGLLKKIMTEKKITLRSVGNQDGKKVKVETEKKTKLLNIPTSDITKLNELIYARGEVILW